MKCTFLSFPIVILAILYTVAWADDYGTLTIPDEGAVFAYEAFADPVLSATLDNARPIALGEPAILGENEITGIVGLYPFDSPVDIYLLKIVSPNEDPGKQCIRRMSFLENGDNLEEGGSSGVSDGEAENDSGNEWINFRIDSLESNAVTPWKSNVEGGIVEIAFEDEIDNRSIGYFLLVNDSSVGFDCSPCLLWETCIKTETDSDFTCDEIIYNLLDQAGVEIYANEPMCNNDPIADAGSDFNANVGDIVVLSGNGADPDGDVIVNYNWTLSAPAGSSTSIANRESSTPSFIPDREGQYLVTLTVSDFYGALSPTDTIYVTAMSSDENDNTDDNGDTDDGDTDDGDTDDSDTDDSDTDDSDTNDSDTDDRDTDDGDTDDRDTDDGDTDDSDTDDGDTDDRDTDDGDTDDRDTDDGDTDDGDTDDSDTDDGDTDDGDTDDGDTDDGDIDNDDAAFTFKLQDSGQNDSYTDTWGEDSDYSINPPSFTDNNDGTVTDNNTGLIWQQKDDNNSYYWHEATGTEDEDYNPDTLNICGDLYLGGFDDWRLPTIKELTDIVNYGRHNPGIDTTYFPDTNSSDYWTSTAKANDSSYVWYVYFSDGNVYFSSKTKRKYVRCVRDGESYSADPVFVDNGNGTVSDNFTELMWQQEDDGSGRTWEEAIIYCENLSHANYVDWRLPNNKELKSIADYSLPNLAVNSIFFPNAKSSDYWSSTTAANSSNEAWSVSFDSGYISRNAKSPSGRLVRCVRGGQ